MDSIELTRYEVAEYPFSRFISDVGGSFGLFLGISAATIVGLIEMMLNILFRSVKRLVSRNNSEFILISCSGSILQFRTTST